MNRLSGPLCAIACLVFVTLAASSCGASAQDPSAPVGFTTSQTYITIENRLGSALAEGLIELVPSGVLAPYRRELPRLESGAKRDVPYRPVLGRRRLAVPPRRDANQGRQDYSQGRVGKEPQDRRTVQLSRDSHWRVFDRCVASAHRADLGSPPGSTAWKLGSFGGLLTMTPSPSMIRRTGGIVSVTSWPVRRGDRQRRRLPRLQTRLTLFAPHAANRSPTPRPAR